jgi:6-phosphogluconolactonase
MKRVLFIFLVSISVFSVPAQKNNYKLLIGTYTTPDKSKGIYSYNIDMNNGVFTEKSVTSGIQNPSFLAVTPDRKFVYSVSESTDGSSANAFSFNDKTGYLKLLNSSLTKSNGPCNISVTANNVFTANYDGGSISVFGKKADGSLTDVLQVIQHTGKSINTERQNEPHVHQVLVTPDTKYVLANDLGTDKVTVYQYNKNATTNVLIPFDTLNVKPGSGPRHSTFSKDGTKVYLVQEIDGTVSVLGLKNGRLYLIQETTVDYKKGIINRTADIHLSPDGNFLYVTNRGTANDITCFSVATNGKLTFRQQVSTGGDGPRNFAITPDGNYVFVANQNTDNIVIFKRDRITGHLANTGKQIKVGAPVCLLFY